MSATTADVAGLAGPSTPYVSAFRRSLRSFVRNRTAVLGIVLILALVFIALAAPLIAPHDPLEQSVRDRLAPPSSEYLLGRDDKGRDILSRIIYGTRVALKVGVLSVCLLYTSPSPR